MPDPSSLSDRLATVQEMARDRQRIVPSAADPDPETHPDPSPGDERLWRKQRWMQAIPSRFVEARVSDFDGEVGEDLSEWSQNAARRNLLLVGGVGTGKTHAAVAACRHAFGRGFSVQFAPVVELLDDLRPGGPDGAMEDMLCVDRLIIDDLGTERPTDWTGERLYALVNRRWLEERPTVFTSNLSLERANGAVSPLEAAVGSRMFSRIVGGSLVLQLAGKDRRRQVKS